MSNDPPATAFGIVAQGWMHKAAPNMCTFKQRYFALHNDNQTLYYFKKQEHCQKFFRSTNAKVKKKFQRQSFFVVWRTTGSTPKGAIDLSTVISIAVSQRLDLPTNNDKEGNVAKGGKGIELQTSDRLWLICPATDTEFVSWLHVLSQIIGRNINSSAKFVGMELVKYLAGKRGAVMVSSHFLHLCIRT